MKSEWADFFDGHAKDYDQNIFTKNTEAEVDFLIEVLELRHGDTILDMGCGTGRHSVELARRGCTITGVDISKGMLQKARERADAAEVEVTWLHANATEFSSEKTFDAAICLCEGAFGLLGSSDDPIEQPLAILHRIEQSLKPHGRCLLTVLNGCAMIRRFDRADIEKGSFDIVGLVERSECEPPSDDPIHPLRERGFVPSELRLMFKMIGLNVRHIWGGTAGNWGKRPVDPDEIEIMVVAEKALQKNNSH